MKHNYPGTSWLVSVTTLDSDFFTCWQWIYSVADAGSRIRIFSIPDSNFFHPGSRIRTFSIPSLGSASKNFFKYFNPKQWFLSSRKYDPGCSSRHRIPDPQHWNNIKTGKTNRLGQSLRLPPVPPHAPFSGGRVCSTAGSSHLKIKKLLFKQGSEKNVTAWTKCAINKKEQTDNRLNTNFVARNAQLLFMTAEESDSHCHHTFKRLHCKRVPRHLITVLYMQTF